MEEHTPPAGVPAEQLEEEKQEKKEYKIEDYYKIIDYFPQLEGGSYEGGRESFGNQYTQVGLLVDMWADLIVGEAKKGVTFGDSFLNIILKDKPESVGVKVYPLQATGFNAPTKNMLFISQGTVKIAVQIAKQGEDLFVTWRAFVQPFISALRAGLFGGCGAIVVITYLILDGLLNGSKGSIVTPNPLGLMINVVVVIPLFLNGFLALRGYFFNNGDFLDYLRDPLNEFHVDDVLILTNFVHKAMIASADSIGVEEAKLEVREPVFKKRRRPRF